MITGTARYQGGTYNTVSGTDEEGVQSRGNYCGYPVAYNHTQQNWFWIQPPSSLAISGAGMANFTYPTVYAPNNPKAKWAGVVANSPCGGNYTPGVGDAPVGNILGPRLINFDVSMRKTFEITERYRLTLNIDSYNVLNHPNFGVPYLNLNSANTPPTGSTIVESWLGLGSAGRPRNISAGARLVF